MYSAGKMPESAGGHEQNSCAVTCVHHFVNVLGLLDPTFQGSSAERKLALKGACAL